MKGVKILKWIFWILAFVCLAAIGILYGLKVWCLGAGVMIGSSLCETMSAIDNILESDD